MSALHEFVPPVAVESSPNGTPVFVARCKCGFRTATYTSTQYAEGTARTHATKQNRRDEARAPSMPEGPANEGNE